MRETRLAIAKMEYGKGNKSHPYVKEFLDELEPRMEPIEKKRKGK